MKRFIFFFFLQSLAYAQSPQLWQEPQLPNIIPAGPSDIRVYKEVGNNKEIYEQPALQPWLMDLDDQFLWIKTFILTGSDLVFIPGKYHSPLTKSTITSNFKRRHIFVKGRWYDFHYGIDLHADPGTPVFSMFDGVVVSAEWNSSYGNVVVVEHEFNGIVFTLFYAHNSKLLVSVGAKVRAGTPISLSGETGVTDGPHVHIELIFYGKAQVDPRLLLGVCYRENGNPTMADEGIDIATCHPAPQVSVKPSDFWYYLEEKKEVPYLVVDATDTNLEPYDDEKCHDIIRYDMLYNYPKEFVSKLPTVLEFLEKKQNERLESKYLQSIKEVMERNNLNPLDRLCPGRVIILNSFDS